MTKGNLRTRHLEHRLYLPQHGLKATCVTRAGGGGVRGAGGGGRRGYRKKAHPPTPTFDANVINYEKIRFARHVLLVFKIICFLYCVMWYEGHREQAGTHPLKRAQATPGGTPRPPKTLPVSLFCLLVV